MSRKKEIEELKSEVVKLQFESRREREYYTLQSRMLWAFVKVSCEKADNVTLKELAMYVLDGKPIIRNNEVAVYEPAEPSTDRTAESK